MKRVMLLISALVLCCGVQVAGATSPIPSDLHDAMAIGADASQVGMRPDGGSFIISSDQMAFTWMMWTSPGIVQLKPQIEANFDPKVLAEVAKGLEANEFMVGALITDMTKPPTPEAAIFGVGKASCDQTNNGCSILLKLSSGNDVLLSVSATADKVNLKREYQKDGETIELPGKAKLIDMTIDRAKF